MTARPRWSSALWCVSASWSRTAPWVEPSPFVGNRQVRNRGTLVGSLAFADPAAEFPAVLVALGATATARSVRGERELACANVATGAFSNSIAADELITSVRV